MSKSFSETPLPLHQLTNFWSNVLISFHILFRLAEHKQVLPSQSISICYNTGLQKRLFFLLICAVRYKIINYMIIAVLTNYNATLNSS